MMSLVVSSVDASHELALARLTSHARARSEWRVNEFKCLRGRERVPQNERDESRVQLTRERRDLPAILPRKRP